MDFFGAYTGPKRLEFSPGDHVIPELTGLAGLPNHVWTSTRRWFDEHLRGIDTGITDEPVVLRVRNAGGAIESYRGLGGRDRPHDALRASATPPGGTGTGPLSPAAPRSGWTETVYAGGDTVADAGVVLLSNGLEALTGAAADGLAAGGQPGPRGGVVHRRRCRPAPAVRGIPRLHLTVTPAAAAGTLIAYLYDVDGAGTGRLITHSPVGWTGAGPTPRSRWTWRCRRRPGTCRPGTGWRWWSTRRTRCTWTPTRAAPR